MTLPQVTFLHSTPQPLWSSSLSLVSMPCSIYKTKGAVLTPTLQNNVRHSIRCAYSMDCLKLPLKNISLSARFSVELLRVMFSFVLVLSVWIKKWHLGCFYSYQMQKQYVSLMTQTIYNMLLLTVSCDYLYHSCVNIHYEA